MNYFNYLEGCFEETSKLLIKPLHRAQSWSPMIPVFYFSMVAPSFGESGGFKFGAVTTAAASSSVPTTGGSAWCGSGSEFFSCESLLIGAAKSLVEIVSEYFPL
jgi:hypothetical protein